MPGIVTMENGGHNGMRTNNEKDLKVNGANGAKVDALQNGVDKGKNDASNDYNKDSNGDVPVNGSQQKEQSQEQSLALSQPRMNDLPNELTHITQGFIPLSLLLTRLTQSSHNSLQEKVAEWAKMAIPAAAMNGNGAHSTNGTDDSSNENTRKKAAILNFAQDLHAKWVKALVITEWSRKAEMVSKLIDLKFHVDQQRMLYDGALDNIVYLKRNLTYARMPSPDLKTALQVLSTGTAPWLPDFDYIAPPPLTPEEQLKWMNDLDTLLSLRLNIEEFDKIPYHFRNYEVNSGRVTFKVPGDFEVDLTIADEDFEKQFWFIDFRFAFQPASSSPPETLMKYLEACVNDALFKDGLAGCYKFLHEFVLTHKLNELRRQALQLSKSSWTGTLKVEQLHRALAIQYWTSRTAPTGPKSWVTVAVHSGRKKNGDLDNKSTSYLTARWYRDNKEVTEASIPLDVENLSTEKLLKTVIGRHIEFILGSIHQKLQETSRYQRRQAGLVLHISESDPAASSLTMQVGYNDSVTLLMEPTTGLFAVKPHSKFTVQYEHQLNNGKSLPEDGVHCLEQIRCNFAEDEINRRGSCASWNVKKAPLNNEELKSAIKVREWTRTIWLQREGWAGNWFVLIVLGLGGDEWWLLETNHDGPNRSPKFQTKLPLDKGHPDPSDAFWSSLTTLTTGVIAQSVDMRELHQRKIKTRPSERKNWSLPQQVVLPSIDVALSDIYPLMLLTERPVAPASESQSKPLISDATLTSQLMLSAGVSSNIKQPWAYDAVTIGFRGIESRFKGSQSADGSRTEGVLTCISDAIIKVRKPAKFAFLKAGVVDRDVYYYPKRGEFCLRLRHDIDKPMINSLTTQIKAVDRFVNFLESMDGQRGTIHSEKITLREVVFSYGEPSSPETGDGEASSPKRWRVSLDLSQDKIAIKLAGDSPHLKVVDIMQRLVNSESGIEALIAWLPVSLPAMMTLEGLKATWENTTSERLVSITLSTRTIDWLNIQYSVATADGSPSSSRQIAFDLRIKIRRGEPWWHVSRSSAPANDSPEDEFTAALKPIWAGKGEGWMGIATSAAANPSNGIIILLKAIDEAMKKLASTLTSVSAPKRPNAQTRPSGKQQASKKGQAGGGKGGPQGLVVLD